MSLAMLYKERKFWPLFWTMFLGAANDNVFKQALVLIITYKSVSLFGHSAEELVAFAGGAFILPYVIFSATSGQISDHYDKAKVIKVTKFTELAFMIIGAIGFITESYALLMLTLFLMGAQSSFFSPVKFSSLRAIFKDEELTTGTALIGGGTFVAILIGTIIGGIAAGAPDSTYVAAISILVFAVFGIFTARFQNKINEINDDVKIDYTFVKPTFRLILDSMKDKNSFRAIMGISWFWFLGSFVLSVMPAIIKNVFFGSEMVASIFMATFTIGMGLGSWICSKLSGKRIEVGMVPLAGLGMSLAVFDLYYISTQWPMSVTGALMPPAEFFTQPLAIRAIIDLLLITIFGGNFYISQLTFMQHSAPMHRLARTIAGNNIWNAIFMVLASVLLMLLYRLEVTPLDCLLILGGLNLIYAAITYYFFHEEMWRFFFHMLTNVLYDIEVEGEENIPKDGKVVIAANHTSFVDWGVVMSLSPRPIRWVIDHRYYFIPGLKQFFMQGHLIPIATRKENPELLDKAYSKLDKTLQEERCVGFFPEGWITRDGKPRRYQPGIKKVVEQTNATVVPIVIKGLWGSFYSFSGKGVFKGIRWNLLKRRKVRVIVLSPIGPDEFCYKDLEDKMVSEYVKPLSS
ncbi:MFS transporter [Halobacteriovorax sp. DPLXC-1]|uniref:MFS transporter n=1 Tax=Halobacteriovorax sp. DPLXC-1 TaxID=3110771 RepID=UPI002FF17BDF